MKNTFLKLFTLFILLFLFLLPSQSIADNRSVINGSTNHLKGKQQLHGYRSDKIAAAKYSGEIEREKTFRLAVSLPNRNKDKVKPLLSELYNPRSPKYRKYLSVEEYADLFSPTEQDYNNTVQYLRSNGLVINATYKNRLVIDVEGNVDNLEKAFHTRLHYYKRPNGTNFYGPDDEPSLDLDTQILQIDGLDNYSQPIPKSTPQITKLNIQMTNTGGVLPKYSGTGTSNTLIGNDFRLAYAPGVALDGTGQSIALVQLDTYYQADIDNYKILTGRTNTIVNVYVNGWSASTVPGSGEGEVVLDINMAMSMAPASTIVVYMGPVPTSVLAKIATDNTCKQISTSWGWAFVINGQYSVEQMLLEEFALQGQSYFDASGDYGAISCDNGWSDMDDLLQTLVGGTELNVDGLKFNGETAWSGSTGGILLNTTIPDYQKSINMSVNGGSTIYRNDPDVSAAADGILSFHNNGVGYITAAGTSAAAPLWAGFIALVNQQASLNGNGPLGFANPSLYAIEKKSLNDYIRCFRDIVSGNNASDGSHSCFNNSTGFNAVPGYDLVTGLGSPKGQALIDALAGAAPVPTATTVAPVCSTWVTNGSAFANMGGGYTLTTAGLFQAGSIWNSKKIDLNQDFNKTFKVYLGSPGGADGINFVLQNDSRGLTALGGSGNNKGYSGTNQINPSYALSLETYNTLGTYSPLLDGYNIADCANTRYDCPYTFTFNVADSTEHTYQVVWTASAKTLSLYFDGQLISTDYIDLVTNLFSGNSKVYYGFTGATGFSSNLQYVYEIGCIIPTATYTPTLTSTPTISPTSSISPTYSVTPTYTTPTFTPTATSNICPSWISNGSAYPNGSGIILTTAGTWQAGSTWNSTPIDLNQGFDFTFKTYFGFPCGADGIDFVLQRDPRGTSALGSYASDKGYSGTGAITPSVAFTIETYSLFCTNNGTLQVQENGITANTCSFATSTCPGVFVSNIADSTEHTYRVTWNPITKYFNLIFDGSTVMTYHRDLINAVFGGNSLVYYGFTAGTGSSSNIQYVYGIGCSNPTSTATNTQSITQTYTPTCTYTCTPSSTPTQSLTVTVTITYSPSPTPSPIVSPTETSTTADTSTITPTNSITPSLTTTPTWTFTTTAPLCASWITNGNAFTSGAGVTLTTNNTWQTGSAWNSNTIDLNNDFNMTFKTYFGSTDGGNGINFVLQNDPKGTLAIGGAGSSRGYYGITSSLSLSIDTSFGNGTLQPQLNGNSSGCFVMPYSFLTNISNANEHLWQIVWTAATKNMTVIFDGVAVQSFNYDLVAYVFGGNSNVYYGFTAATGVTSNLQYVYEVGCSYPTATSTITPSYTITLTPTPTSSGTPTFSPSFTTSSSPTFTLTPSYTQSITPTITETVTETVTGTDTSTATFSPTYTTTMTISPTFTITETLTETSTETNTSTYTATCTYTQSPSVTETTTGTYTSTFTPTSSFTPSFTVSCTPTITPTYTYTSTPSYTFTLTLSMTPSITVSRTVTRTVTCTYTMTPSITRTQTPENTTTPTATIPNSYVPDKPVIYPNPSEGKTPPKMLVPLTTISDVRIQIYTVAFRKISDKIYKDVIPGSPISMEIVAANGNKFASGVFYVEIIAQDRHWTSHLLIIR